MIIEIKEKMNGVTLLGDEVRDTLMDSLKKSSPSDIINLNVKSRSKLLELWQSHNQEKRTGDGYLMLSDVFFAATIPLMDCILSVDESEVGGSIFTTRIMIFEGYEKVNNYPDGEVSLVGLIITAHKDA